MKLLNSRGEAIGKLRATVTRAGATLRSDVFPFRAELTKAELQRLIFLIEQTEDDPAGANSVETQFVISQT